MKTLVRSLLGIWFFVNIASAARTDISLLPSDWTDNGTPSPSARTLTQTSEGYLRGTCNTYRGYISYRSRNTCNFQGATVRYKWRVNCAGQYCWTQDGTYPWSRMSTYSFSTHHSWSSSIVISSNTWIYTEIHFNPNRTWSADYSYSGYGLGGINHNSGTITEANWNYLATSFLSKYVGDGYANSFYFDIAEAYAETPGPVVAITTPTDGSVFDPSETISFNASVTGGISPYEFTWTSDTDGTLGVGNAIAISTLSQGTHVITATCVDNASETNQASITVHITVPPIIEPIANETITDSSSYSGPVPVLTQGQTLTTWTLVEGPATMTLNANTGQVSWTTPTISGSPFTVTLRAQNPKGFDEVSWQLSVLSLPQIETIPAQTATELTAFTSQTPVLLKGTEPVEWQLASGPATMTIDPATGVVSWENPLPSFSAYSVTIRAINSVGSDSKTFTILVQSIPQIAAISDVTIIGGHAYNLTPVLVKGVPAVTWSLTQAPEGMAINETTGAISWPNPSPENSVHTVTIQAANLLGGATVSYQIRVMLPPVLETLSNETIHEAISFSRSVPVSQGSLPLTFTLLSAPAAMSINPSSGAISWGYANGNNSPYTVTVRASNEVGTDQKSFVLTVLQRPLMKLINNTLAAEGAAYTAQTPALYQGSAPITWSLVNGPAGLSIDENSGITNWPSAIYTGSSHSITIQAQNVVGMDTKTWQVTVVQTPLIAEYGNQIIGNSTSYIAGLPSLTQGSHVTWSLEEAPTGMTINALTGQIAWPSPIASGTPHIIQIKAANIAGVDTEEFQLTVLAKPLLAAIENITTAENKPFVSNPAQLLAGQPPVTFSLSQAPAGMTVDPNSGAYTWPKPTAAGSPHTVRLRASNAYGSDEKTFNVTVPVGYAADAWTDIEIASAGTPIPIQGHAYYLSDGTEIANVTIQLQIKVRNTTRVYTSQTDAQGDFEFTFQPLPQEAGLYAVYVGHPLQVPQTAQDTFILAAMRATDSQIRPSFIEGDWYETTVNLKNPGDTELTNISASKIGGPNSIEIDFTPLPVLPPDSTQPVTLRMKAIDASVLQSVVSVLFTNDQNAQSTVTYSVQVIPLTPQLTVFPKTLNLGMVRGQVTNVSFEVFNKGGKATPELIVLVPDSDWLSMNNPENIGVHEPNDVTVVTLTLNPDAALPLGPYTGSIIVYGTGMTQTIPFNFNCVSNQVGGLDMEAVDEFTYYAAGAPRIANASVTLRNAFDGSIVYFNEPMPDGTLLLENVAENYYTLEVQAPEHGRYSATVYAAPGVNSKVTAFLPRQLVKYTWTVVPTEIEDKYTVTLNTTYETHVPAPVVVIEPANVDLSKMVNGQMQVDFTITNHGLVAAEEFHLMFDNHPRYQVQLLTDFRGQIGPDQTIVVPALVTDLQFGPILAAPNGVMPAGDSIISPGLGDCDPVKGGGYYTLVCGKDRKWHKQPITIANWLCDLYNLIPQLGGGDDDDYDPDGGDDSTPPGTWPETGSGQTPGSGGGTGGGSSSGGGVLTGGRKPGTSPRRPIVTPPAINGGGGSGNGGCDPCPQLRMEALLECAWSILPTSCGASVVKGIYDSVRNCWGEETISFNCVLSCQSSIVSIITSCAKNLSPLGLGYNITICIYSLITACDTNNAAAYQSAAADFESLTGMDIPNVMPDSSESLAFLIEQAHRLEAALDAMNTILGDPIWFSGVEGEEPIFANWMEALGEAMSETSDGGEWISQAEQDALRVMPLPSQITSGHVDAVCRRWNRSLEYWQAGKFKASDLQPGDDPDFIAMDVSFAKFEQANNAVLANEAQGYFDFFDGVADGIDQLKVTLEQEAKGVCAKVHLQIEQSAVMTRTAFRATLDIQNQSQVDSLDNLRVELEITDAQGSQAVSLFGIYPPIVTGLPDVSGGGNLNPGKQLHAEWLLVPTLDAAPDVEKQYLVGGSIRYTVNGNAVTFPIFPDTITVKPDANLHLKYFFEKEVYGDDPFTPDVIEPSTPFVLGLMVSNTGAGSAYNMTVASAQPIIIRHENDKDILINFALLDATVDNESRVPSLQVNLGHIPPNSSKVAQWHMQCSLQGEFTNYAATFAHTDTLGESRLSLIQSAATHSLIHAVRADRTQDDDIADFLTNDIPDMNTMPDTLHLSEGQVESVTAWQGQDDWFTGYPQTGSITLTLPQSPDGFFYVRLPNPGWPHFELKQVVRSDGKTLLEENAWTTYRRQYPLQGDPYVEIYLHLFDIGGTGIYTLYFEAAEDLPPAATGFEIADVMNISETPLPLTVTFADNIGVDANSLDGLDILVSGPAGQSLAAEFVQILSQNGGSMTVQYQILPPGGLWEGSDNGLYSIQLAANQVADSAGQFAPDSTLGGFLVSIPQCVDVEVISCDLINQVRISRTEFDMTYTLTLKNHCNKPIRNLRVIPQEIQANLQLMSHDINFCYIAPNAQDSSQGTFTVRMDYANPPDTLTQFQWRLIPYGPADVNMDGAVNIADLAQFAAAWLGSETCYDWAPQPNGDGSVDMQDFTVIAEHWLQ